jgi:hypothetical protein
MFRKEWILSSPIVNSDDEGMRTRSSGISGTHRQLFDADALRLVIGHLTTVRATVIAAYPALEHQASGFDVDIAESLRRCGGDALFRALQSLKACRAQRRHTGARRDVPGPVNTPCVLTRSMRMLNAPDSG